MIEEVAGEKAQLEKRHISIGVPKGFREDIRKGCFHIIPPDLPTIHGWDIGLASSSRGGGWIHLSLHCDDVDGFYYMQNRWVASFRQSDINKRTWRKIQFEEGDVLARLIWREDYEEEIKDPRLAQDLSVGSIGHSHMLWYIDFTESAL
jgi:hypothetical protein